MLIIGLTGSIATGKSTVSSMLAGPPYNLPVVDADVLARQVVEPGTRGYRAIVDRFGPSTPDLLEPASADMPQSGPSGRGRPLNRPALGRRVFGTDPERQRDRAALNAIVHPAVRREMLRLALLSYLRGCWAVVLDVPLLFEGGLDTLCGAAVVVGVRDPAVQMRRLRDRDAHLTPEDAENRVRSQGDVREKARRCEARGPGRGLVLWNDGSRDELRAQLDAAVARIHRENPSWWAMVLLACPPLAVAVAAWRYWENIEINKRWEAAQKQAKDIKGKL